jgi:hypothetical protein
MPMHVHFPKHNDILIETGSHKGDGIQMALDSGFKEVRSVEVELGFYQMCQSKFAKDSRVKLYHGDTVKLLWGMIKDLNEPMTFWLDAHHGECGSIIEKELVHIARHPIKTHTILIDDKRLWGGSYDIVVAAITAINPSYIIESFDGTDTCKQDVLYARIV